MVTLPSGVGRERLAHDRPRMFVALASLRAKQLRSTGEQKDREAADRLAREIKVVESAKGLSETQALAG